MNLNQQKTMYYIFYLYIISALLVGRLKQTVIKFITSRYL